MDILNESLGSLRFSFCGVFPPLSIKLFLAMITSVPHVGQAHAFLGVSKQIR